MHHLSQQHIDMKVRRPHLARFKKQLIESLRDPGLSAEQVQMIRSRLERLGKPKEYREGTTPPGGLNPGPIPKRPSKEIAVEIGTFTNDYLFGLPHSTLARYCKQEGLEVRMTDPKATLVAAILNSKGNNQ